MISPLPGWSFEPRGLNVFLYPKSARAAAVVRYVERQRPVRTFDELLRAHLDTINPRHRITSVSSLERFVTREGEESATANIDLVVDARRARQIIAWTHVDEFFSETGGMAVDAQWFEPLAVTVRALAVDDAHFMQRRRRHYRFTPPRDWMAVTHGSAFTNVWHAPDGTARLTVAASVPIETDDALDSLLSAHRRLAISARPEQPLVLPSGLNGRTRELRLPGGRIRLVAVLRDYRNLYPLHLDTTRDDHWRSRVLFNQVLSSIAPLPHAGIAPLTRLAASGLLMLD